MLWAMQHPDQVERMIVLNTPLGRQCKLRPELAAYKSKMAFMRPDPQVAQPSLSASACQCMAYSMSLHRCANYVVDVKRVCNLQLNNSMSTLSV